VGFAGQRGEGGGDLREGGAHVRRGGAAFVAGAVGVHRDLSRTRNQIVCRLHAVLCDLIPGGAGKHISAALAARVLEQAVPSGAVQAARHQLSP
jgi:hypothetical protein